VDRVPLGWPFFEERLVFFLLGQGIAIVDCELGKVLLTSPCVMPWSGPVLGADWFCGKTLKSSRSLVT